MSFWPQGIAVWSAPTVRVGEHPNSSSEQSSTQGPPEAQPKHLTSLLLCFGAFVAPGNKVLESVIGSEKVALVFRGLTALTPDTRLSDCVGSKYITLKGI